jgi:hypothetical protein
MRLLLSCLLLTGAVVLASCGGGDETAKVEEVIETSATSTDPADCKGLETQKLIEQLSRKTGQAALAQCEEEAREEKSAKSVEVSGVEVDGSSATADVAMAGGSLGGQAVKVELVKHGDQWKMDEIVEFTQFNRAKLVEDLEGELNEYLDQLGPKIGSCFFNAFEEGSQEEVEELLFGGSVKPFAEVAEACAATHSA